uniref:Uncharacterized protein n=1 Tax=Anguilla anguilla TaxID=7936 RepID=A0A0E9WC46_ANGAN
MQNSLCLQTPSALIGSELGRRVDCISCGTCLTLLKVWVHRKTAL